MIFTIFLTIAYYILGIIINFFPISTGFSTDVYTSFQYFAQQTTILQPIFPFDTMGQVLAILFVVELAIFGFETVKWLISHIPWIGGHG